MKRIFTALGVDFDQWKALVLVALKMDVRGTSIASGMNAAQEKRGRSLVFVVLFYVMMGGLASSLIFFIPDPLVSGTIIVTYLMFMVGMMVLVDHQSVITSPDDYVVLGFRPVSSPTYFAVRLTNVLVYTMALTTAFGIVPIVAFTVGHGFLPIVGLAAMFAFFLSTFFATLVLVLAYAWLLRVVGADRLKRALSYLQLVMGFLVYGGYFLMSRAFGRSALAQLSLPDTPLMLLYPPTWFASIIALASGQAQTKVVVSVVAAFAAIALVATRLGGRFTLGYTEQLGAVSSASENKSRQSVARRPIWFKSGEGRAIALLVRGQMRNDQKFRMGVFGILPLTILYIFMSLQNGPLPDPFSPQLGRFSDSMLINIAVMLFPIMLRLNLTRSDSYRASWIYFVSPSNRSALIAATRSVVVAFFLVPYLVFVAAILIYITRSPLHILIHVIMLGLVSHLFLQVVLLTDPELPFSLPIAKGTKSMQMFLTMMGSSFAAIAVGPLLSLVVYRSALRIVIAVAMLLGLSMLIERLTRFRVERIAARLEFAA